MSTLQHLDMALVNIRERLTSEQEFSVDAERNILDAIGTVEEALEDLSRKIKAAFAERHRALTAAIGAPAADNTGQVAEGVVATAAKRAA